MRRALPKTDEEDREKIISAIEPFDDIDLMIFTHEHPDHFEGSRK